MILPLSLLQIQLILSLFLTGLIWTIQCVHYPSFAFVSETRFEEFNVFHQQAITYIVAPAMVVELGLASYHWSRNIGDLEVGVLTGFVFLIWLSTFFLSVPLHNKLVSQGFDSEVIRQLVVTNWPRTILWTLRSLGLIWLVSLQ